MIHVARMVGYSKSNQELLDKFGASIKKLRERTGTSQEQLAEAANLHRTYISSIERGERNVSLINIHKLAAALGVDTPDLLR